MNDFKVGDKVNITCTCGCMDNFSIKTGVIIKQVSLNDFNITPDEPGKANLYGYTSSHFELYNCDIVPEELFEI